MTFLEKLRLKREAAAKKLADLMALIRTEERALTTDEQATADATDGELASLDATIRREEAAQAAAATAAIVAAAPPAPRTITPAAVAAPSVAITATDRLLNPQTPAAARTAQAAAPRIIMLNRDPNADVHGISMTRIVIAQTLARLDGVSAVTVARHRWGAIDPQLVRVVEALHATGGNRYGANEVAGGGGAGWGNELTIAQLYAADFIEYLYAQTVMDRLPLTAIPEDVTIKGQDGSATGYWVGDGRPIPATALDFMDVTLTNLQLGALAVITKALLRRSAPSAEVLVRDGLAKAAAQRLDGTAFSTTAASAGVSPAGLYNGLSAVGDSAGTDADGVRQDVASLVNAFVNAKNASGLVWAMHPTMAVTLAMMVNELGIRDFGNINADGGDFFGYPVFTGHNVSTTKLTLLKPSDIYKIEPKQGGEGLDIAVSDQATIEMSSAPTANVLSSPPVAGSAVPVSMFQTDSVAIKVVRPTNYAKRRSSAVQFVDNVAYSLLPST